MSRATRPDWWLAVLTLAVAVSSTLPFASVGGPIRSAWSLALAARQLGLDGSFVVQVGVWLISALVIVVGLVWCLLTAGRRRLGAFVAALQGLVGLVIGLAGLVTTGRPEVGAAAFCVTGALTISASLWVVRTNPRESVRVSTPVRMLAWLFAGGAIVGGTAIVFLSVRAPLGAGRPADAAREFYRAIDRGDPIDGLEMLAPGERAVVVEAGPAVLNELRRLKASGGLLRRSTIDSTRTFQETAVLPGVTTVELTSGTAPKRLRAPKGPLASDIASLSRRLVTVKVGGHWYVSLGYSVAESRRLAAGRARPTVARTIDSVGYGSPEAAVRAFVDAAGRFDLTGVLRSSDPDEIEPALTYAPLIMEDVNRSANSLRADYQLSFPALELITAVDGDVAVVRIARWSALLTLPATEVEASTIALDQDCVDITIAGQASQRCGSEVPLVLNDVFGVTVSTLNDRQTGWLTNPTALPGIVTVRRRGKWYVSPTRSAAAYATLWLNGLRPEDLRGRGNGLNDRLSRVFSSVSDSLNIINGQP
jgi:hypothetical protein